MYCWSRATFGSPLSVCIPPAACQVEPGRQLAPLEQHDVGPAGLREVVQHARADDAPTDDDDLGLVTSRGPLVHRVTERVADVEEIEPPKVAIACVEDPDPVLAHQGRQVRVGDHVPAGEPTYLTSRYVAQNGLPSEGDTTCGKRSNPSMFSVARSAGSGAWSARGLVVTRRYARIVGQKR